jgi:lysophospholipase
MKLVSIDANPVPENVVMGTLRTLDGVGLRYARWAPPAGRKGTVCLFQGRAEFIEKYYETVSDLRARGFAVATLDWRGQGLSDRPLSDRHKGHVGDFSEYDADLEVFMREVVLPDCPPPLFALGHSMGAAVLIRAARQGHRWFDRIVLSTPMITLYGRGAGDGAGDAACRIRFQLCALRGDGGGGHATFRRQHADVRSGALCAQRRHSGGGARARLGGADGGLG